MTITEIGKGEEINLFIKDREGWPTQVNVAHEKTGEFIIELCWEGDFGAGVDPYIERHIFPSVELVEHYIANALAVNQNAAEGA